MKQLLESIIKEWHNRTLPSIIPRQINLEKYINLKVRKVISIVGFRRSGKTYLLLDLAKKVGQNRTIYINFEDERLPRKVETLTTLLDLTEELFPRKHIIFLLDEIQNVPNWHLWARRVIENTSHHLFISGSSSKLSSYELPSHLRGRSLTVHISPLNYFEFNEFKHSRLKDLPKSQVLANMREYLNYGGFPEIVLSEEGEKTLIIDEYYRTFIRKDIIERYKIRNEEEFKLLIQIILNSPYFTYSKLNNYIKSFGYSTSKTTIIKYIEYLKENFFLKEVFLHQSSIKNRLKAPKKPIFVDNYLLSRFSTEFSHNIGILMENLVGIQLYVKHKNLYYWKDYQGNEIDFVIRNGETTEELIQVSYVNNRSDIKPRESKALNKACRNLRAKKLTLITWDYEDIVINDKKIFCIPLYKWLSQQ